MAATPEKIGLLVIHGMGEQEKLYHLKDCAREIASAVGTNPNVGRLAVSDETSSDCCRIVIDTVVKRDDGPHHVSLCFHEVWWANLGIKGGLWTQFKFWLWGLGQWAADVAFAGKPRSNTTQLMILPRFKGQREDDDRRNLLGRAPAHLALFGAGILAILTFFTWSVAKTLVRLVAQRAPDPSLIYLFLGDVMTYERPAAPGKGTVEDPDLPIRTTIRRRMVRGITEVAKLKYDRWYILAHSLGSVPAYNALQEVELTLPSYLTQEEWDELDQSLKTNQPFIPEGRKPTTEGTMPRRPPWLADTDGISRVKLFERFFGLVTYGSPLDKFAALWPRIVPLNRQTAVFQPGCEWLNLHDPTDPASAKLDAFDPPPRDANELDPDLIPLRPKSVATRAGWLFLLSHIFYLRPKKDRRKAMAAAIVDALLTGSSIVKAAESAEAARIPPWRYGLRVALTALEVVILFALLLVGAALLLTKIADLLRGDDWGCPGWIDWRNPWCRDEFLLNVGLALVGAMAAVGTAGAIRFISDWVRHHRDEF